METMMEKIQRLIIELNHASDEYYNKNNSVMSDKEWDEKEESFNFKSIGLRWLESNPSAKVIKMILGFCEMMTSILENND